MESTCEVVFIVAALLPKYGIGCNGTLPWRLSKEIKYFKQVTTSTFSSDKQNAVVMGRRTWESIPPKFRPLPHRVNVVISSKFEPSLTRAYENGREYYRVNSFTQCLACLRNGSENGNGLGKTLERIYVIGGAQVYNQNMDAADSLLITKLKFVGGSTGAREPDMDSFLDVDGFESRFYETSAELPTFLPPGARQLLPQQPPLESNDADGSSGSSSCGNGTIRRKYVDSEGDYSFEYTLYRRREAS